MKKLLKIALLLCAVSGQAMGANARDGGEKSAIHVSAAGLIQFAQDQNLLHGAYYSPFSILNPESTTLQTGLTKEKAQKIHPKLFNALHGIKVHHVNGGRFVTLTQLTQVFQDEYNTEIATLKANHETQLKQLQQEQANRWSTKKTVACTLGTVSLVGVSGYLAYQNRASLQITFKNFFVNKMRRFAPLAPKVQ